MKIVGLTGGIGSGKSTIAREFSQLGIPIYTTDESAKILMAQDLVVKQKIIDLLGSKAYHHEKLQRQWIGEQIFKDQNLRAKLNAIVHPAVAKDFETWLGKQKAPYVLKESAILFEIGGDRYCDATILVTAPKEIRIQRVIKRDRTTREAVLARINAQWTDKEKEALATYIIHNIDRTAITQKVVELHQSLMR